MSLEMIAFVLMSAGLLGTSSAVLIARNPIHSALYLILSFFCLAGLYLLLNANFVAIIQVLVYAGAIMVLFLFVIMLLNLSDEELGESRLNLHKVLGVGGGLALVGLLVWAITGAQDRYLNDATFMRSEAVKQLVSKVYWPREFEDRLWKGMSTDAELQIYKQIRAWRRLNQAVEAYTREGGESGERAMCALALPELMSRAKSLCADALPGAKTCEVLWAISDAAAVSGCSGVLSAGLSADTFQQAQQYLASSDLSGVPAVLTDLQTATTQTREANLSHLNVEGVADLYLSLFELRTLSQEKLRFEHGQGAKQAEACLRLSAVIPELDSGRCMWLIEDAPSGQSAVDMCFALEETLPASMSLCDPLSSTKANDPKRANQDAQTLERLTTICKQVAPFGGLAASSCRRLSAMNKAIPTNPTERAKYASACEDVVQSANAMVLPRCSALRGDFVATVIAQTDTASEGFEAKLAQAEATMDASPVPGSWRGLNAFRRPALEMSRYELAIADAIGVFFAWRLNHDMDAFVLDPERRARVAYQVQRDVGLNDGRTAQAGVFERARRRYELLLETNAVQGAEAQNLKTWFEADQAEYRALLAKSLVSLRAGKPGDVAAIIRDLLQRDGASLDLEARAHVESVLNGLASPQGGRDILNKPAVYDEDEFGSVRAVGRDMFTNLLLPFEVTSVLLLAAIMGAVVIAKRRS